MAKRRQGSNIFISYSQVDAPKLETILKYLVSAGFIKEEDKILREEDLPVKHRALREQVKRQIHSASKVIVLWDSDSANSQWVNYELGLADAFGKEIIAVVPKKTRVALPTRLQDVQVVMIASDG
jgi:hypothetical protein